MSERSGSGPGAGWLPACDAAAVRTDLFGARLAGARFGAAFLAAGLRVAALRVAGLRVAGRRAVAEAVASDAILRTCLVSASRRFIALSRSAWRAVRSRRLCTCLIAVLSVFCPSCTVRSICLRTSGGTRLSA